MSEDDKLELMELKIFDSLPPELEGEFEELLETDPDFARTWNFLNDLATSAEALGNMELKAHFQQLETQMKRERVKGKLANVPKKAMEHLAYSMEQLIEHFRPAPDYSRLLAYTHRSKGLGVMSPQNEMDCVNSRLNFELSAATNSPISVQVENNRQETVWEQTVEEASPSFSIGLPENLPPGIYYWKLHSKGYMTIGAFYIRKDLKPE